MINRRKLAVGLGALFVCAPAIVRIASLMPVKVQPVGELRIYLGGVLHKVPVMSFDFTNGEVAQVLADSINRSPQGIVASQVRGNTVDLYSRAPAGFSRIMDNPDAVWKSTWGIA